jgi:regulator of sigma E protease
MSYIITAIVFVLMFSILVAAHELGHYLAARACRMGVEEFAVGFGKPIIKTLGRKKTVFTDGTEQETVFNLRPFPLGGFVKIVGQEPKEDGSEVNIKGGFYSKTPLQRIFVLVAGPFFSVLAGLLVLFPTFLFFGSIRVSTIIAPPLKDYPAMKAGMKAGDKILSINGTPVKIAEECQDIIRNAKSSDIVLLVQRANQKLTFLLKPQLSSEKMPILDEEGEQTGQSEKRFIIGVEFTAERYRLSAGEALSTSLMAPVKTAKGLFSKLAQPKVLVEQSNSPIGMAVITHAILDQDTLSKSIQNVLILAGSLSISLGIFNLIPLGILDGGQILIAICELFRKGKRLSFNTQLSFINAGMLLILVFFFFVVKKEILGFFKGEEKPPVKTEKPNQEGARVPQPAK